MVVAVSCLGVLVKYRLLALCRHRFVGLLKGRDRIDVRLWDRLGGLP